MQEAAVDLTADGPGPGFDTGVDFLGRGNGGGYIEASNVFTGNEPRSISLWFNNDVITYQARLVGMGGGAASQFDITLEDFGSGPGIGLRYGNGNMSWTGTAEFGQPIQTDQWYHVAVVYDGTTLVADSTLKVYVDGTLLTRDDGNNNNSGQVLTTADTNFWIGVGTLNNFAFDGTIDEVKLFDHALTAQEVADLAMAPTFSELSLQVNTTTGLTTLLNASDEAIDIDYYQLISATEGALDTDGWSSLEDQDLDGNGTPNDGIGWEEAGGVDTEQLIESFLRGSSSIAADSQVDLGNAYDVGTGASDLVFEYHDLSRGNVLISASVEYVTSPATEGDFDLSGVVDQGDLDLALLTWEPTWRVETLSIPILIRICESTSRTSFCSRPSSTMRMATELWRA